MTGKTDKNPQLKVFRPPLVNVINMKHELVKLAQRINWILIEQDLAPYYSDMERPAVPVRKMIGCMLLKQMYHLLTGGSKIRTDSTFMARPIFNMMRKLRQIRNPMYFVLVLLTGSWSVKYTTVQNY